MHKFLGRFGHLLCNQPEAEMGELDWQQLKASCINGKVSVGGLDGFTPADFSILSDTVFQWLVAMLNRIEMGAAWPDQPTLVKAAYLAKDPNKLEDPLAYRV